MTAESNDGPEGPSYGESTLAKESTFMEWFRFGSRTAGLLAVLYAATVMELSWPADDFTPSWIALAATLAVCVSSTSTSVFWAAAGGFVIDATSRGPLGPFLMAYGLLVSVFVSAAPVGRRTWWFTPAVAFTLAAAHPMVIMLLARLDAASVVEPMVIIKATVIRGSVTAFAATLGVLMSAILQRLWSPSQSREPMQLSNRWTMLTE